MKKIYTLIVSLALVNIGFAQVTLLSQNFNSYDGDTANFLSGYYVSWNSPSGGSPSASFYSSSGNFGAAPNSYKFGIDSATIITPYFASADTMHFWYKGNGTGTAANKFMIYTSSDSVTFTAMDSLTTFPSIGTTYGHLLDSSAHYLKFIYHKAVGNVAFDDLTVVNNQGVGIKKNSNSKAISIYPNPSSNGVFMLDLGLGANISTLVEVFNILGNSVCVKNISQSSTGKYLLNLNELPAGSYFANVKTGNEKKMIRLVIN